MLQVNLISGQNDFNQGWFVISLSLFMITNTRDKEITDQPRLNHFDLKSNSNCNITYNNNSLMTITIIFIITKSNCLLIVLPNILTLWKLVGRQVGSIMAYSKVSTEWNECLNTVCTQNRAFFLFGFCSCKVDWSQWFLTVIFVDILSSPVFSGLFDFCSIYTGASLEGAVRLNQGVGLTC